MLLIDSTIYIDWFRHRIDPLPLLQPFVKARTLAICGVIRAEVVRGVICPEQKMKIHALFNLLEDIAIDSEMWHEIAELAWSLDRRGIVLPLTDIVIAGCALRMGATLVTTDEHFSKISRLKILRTLPDLG
jgi:predicted nucleic acid-binding protein